MCPIDFTFITCKEIQFHVVKPVMELGGFGVGVGGGGKAIDVPISNVEAIAWLRCNSIAKVEGWVDPLGGDAIMGR